MRSILRSAFIASGALRSSQISHQRSLHLKMSTDGTQSIYPELTVYDMDACLWDQEMYTMSALPGKKVMGDLNGRGEGVTGGMCKVGFLAPSALASPPSAG